MTSKEFIIDKIKELSEKFNSFTFKYQFDNLDFSHVIEYSPFDLINGNQEFKNIKLDIIDEYMRNHFEESIVFIDEFDPVGLDNIEILHQGHFCFEPKDELLNSKEINIVEGSDSLFAGETNYALAA